MFAVGPVVTASAASNTGTATIAVTRTSLSSLTADDYTLRQTGGAWKLTDKTTGQVVPMTGTGTAANPFTAAGISIVVGGGAAANGDSFLIQPTAGAAAGLAVLLTSPAQIAAASSIQTTAAVAEA